MTDSRPDITEKCIVLVGLMGVGKSSVGRKLAKRLGMGFTDADDEIIRAAGCSIEDIFELYGESAFRDGERRVIRRLLNNTPKVLATGGGAFMDPDTRSRIKRQAVSIWLRADIEVLLERTGRRSGRPLLKKGDPRKIFETLMAERNPSYAEADFTIDSEEESSDATVDSLIRLLETVYAIPQAGDDIPS
ncbi:MAG: shikimate kinase [Rhodospirillales bacterium]|nr:shikimate kinase [Rhodospirillales bacterium]